MGNNFLGNGGTELNQTSQLYDLDYRNYDPILGRMNGIDPMATKYASLSPYSFSFNDPVTFNDVSGADPYQRSDDTWWVASRESLAGGRYTGYSSLNDFLRENRPSGVLAMDDPWAWTGMSSGEIYGPSFSMYGVGSGNGSISHQEYMVAVEQAKAQGGRVEYHHGRYWVSIPLVRTFFVDTPDDPYYSGYNVTMTWAGREDIVVGAPNQGRLFDQIQPNVDRMGDYGGFFISLAETPFVAAAGEKGLLKAFDKGFTSSYRSSARFLNNYTRTAATGLKFSTKAFGTAGLVVGSGVAAYNISTGNGELSDIADIAVIGVSVAVIGIAGVTAAPFVAAAGLIYGGFMLFGGEDYINNSQIGKSTANLLKF